MSKDEDVSATLVSVGEDIYTSEEDKSRKEKKVHHSFLEIEPIADIPELVNCEWTCSDGTSNSKLENQNQIIEKQSNVDGQHINMIQNEKKINEKQSKVENQDQRIIQKNKIHSAGSSYSEIEKTYDEDKMCVQEKRLYEIQCQLQELSLLPSAIQTAIDDINEQLNQLVHLLTISKECSLEKLDEGTLTKYSEKILSNDKENTLLIDDDRTHLEIKPFSSEPVENNVQKMENDVSYLPDEGSPKTDQMIKIIDDMESQKNQVSHFHNFFFMICHLS